MSDAIRDAVESAAKEYVGGCAFTLGWLRSHITRAVTSACEERDEKIKSLEADLDEEIDENMGRCACEHDHNHNSPSFGNAIKECIHHKDQRERMEKAEKACAERDARIREMEEEIDKQRGLVSSWKETCRVLQDSNTGPLVDHVEEARAHITTLEAQLAEVRGAAKGALDYIAGPPVDGDTDSRFLTTRAKEEHVLGALRTALGGEKDPNGGEDDV